MLHWDYEAVTALVQRSWAAETGWKAHVALALLEPYCSSGVRPYLTALICVVRYLTDRVTPFATLRNPGRSLRLGSLYTPYVACTRSHTPAAPHAPLPCTPPHAHLTGKQHPVGAALSADKAFSAGASAQA